MSSSSSRYIHSVDGLRAVAVLAVLLYHLGIDWIPGGFLGVISSSSSRVMSSQVSFLILLRALEPSIYALSI